MHQLRLTADDGTVVSGPAGPVPRGEDADGGDGRRGHLHNGLQLLVQLHSVERLAVLPIHVQREDL